MMDQFEKLVSAFNRAAPAPFLGIAIATTLIIFLPDAIAKNLGILEFRQLNKGAIGWAFLLTYSYLIAHVLWQIKDIVRNKLIKYFATKKYQKKLHDLTPAEKGLLVEFMSGENTLHMPIEDGVIGGLQAKEIVFQSSNAFVKTEGVPYNLQTWARQYLAENTELLSGAEKRKISRYERI
jgi:hypothetical protein